MAKNDVIYTEQKRGLFGRTLKQPEVAAEPPPKEEPKQEVTSQETQINTVIMHMQRSMESLELAHKEFINLLKNA